MPLQSQVGVGESRLSENKESGQEDRSNDVRGTSGDLMGDPSIVAPIESPGTDTEKGFFSQIFSWFEGIEFPDCGGGDCGG